MLNKTLLVFGGNGYVGSKICETAVANGVKVISVCRSGKSNPCARSLEGHGVMTVRGDIMDPSTYNQLIPQVNGVVSCVGAFGSKAHMELVCGQANIVAVEACSKHPNLEMFGFISAHQFKHPPSFLEGYYNGKKAAESEILHHFGLQRSLILRCPMIYGPRPVGKICIPLQLIGKPLEIIGSNWLARKAAEKIPFLDLFLVPPVPISLVANLMVLSLLHQKPRGILTPYQMLESR